MSSFEALLSTIQALADVHGKLLDLSERKKHVLIQNKVEELMKITNQETKLLKQVSELDAQRIDVMGKFMIERGYKPNSRVTVSQLSKIIFKIEDKKRLQEKQKQLLSVIDQLKRANQLCQQLLEQSIMFVDYSLDLLIGPPEDDTTYIHPQQALYGQRKSSMFNVKM